MILEPTILFMTISCIRKTLVKCNFGEGFSLTDGKLTPFKDHTQHFFGIIGEHVVDSLAIGGIGDGVLTGASNPSISYFLTLR